MAVCGEDIAERLAPANGELHKAWPAALGAIAASAGGVKSTTLTMCAHDPFEASNDAIGLRKATQQDTSRTIEVLDLDLLVARGCLTVEGCIRTEDPHLTAQHIMAGVEEAWGALLLGCDGCPWALPAAGRMPPQDLTMAVNGSPRVMPIRVPQLWDDLVKFANGKGVSFIITEGGQVQAHSPTQAQENFLLCFTTENRARAKLASPLHDPDGSVGRILRHSNSSISLSQISQWGENGARLSNAGKASCG